MKFAVIDRGDPLSVELKQKIIQLASEQGLILDQEYPEYVISIGGDGTLLKAFHHYAQHIDNVAFVGIHTGHLGFYADWQVHEIEELISAMANNEPHIVNYPLASLEIKTTFETKHYYALNEFTLKSVNSTLVAHIELNDQPFEMFRGDGLVISTPSGSTAYNKSVGGAVVHPSIDMIQLSEIASINNRIFRTLGSSIILPKHHHLDIKNVAQQTILISIDHQAQMLTDLISVRCCVANKKVKFARFRSFPFWNRVRDAFIDSDSLKQ